MGTTNGFIHLYTGNGKGKTTAAIGLAIRAVGAGKKVFIGQFVKGMQYSELVTFARLPEINVRQYGSDCFIENNPTDKDIEAAHKGLKEVESIIANNKYDVIILDEICIALYYNLFTIEDFAAVLSRKNENTEIVLTGRYAHPFLYEIADLITEMKEVKHYFNRGVQARKGIEY